MIIGNGQLATIFSTQDRDDVCFFASGLSNSNCTDEKQFNREKTLLLEMLEKTSEKKFIYFSSCALSAPEYPKNGYYQHKRRMEKLIQEISQNYLIFRLPQLFGKFKHHTTLINLFYESILYGREFTIYSEAYRYVIDIEDVKILVSNYVKYYTENSIFNLANPYQYKVLDIVFILEKLINKKAIYSIVKKSDFYYLDLSHLEDFVIKNSIDISFGYDYLNKNLEKYFK